MGEGDSVLEEFLMTVGLVRKPETFIGDHQVLEKWEDPSPDPPPIARLAARAAELALAIPTPDEARAFRGEGSPDEAASLRMDLVHILADRAKDWGRHPRIREAACISIIAIGLLDDVPGDNRIRRDYGEKMPTSGLTRVTTELLRDFTDGVLSISTPTDEHEVIKRMRERLDLAGKLPKLDAILLLDEYLKTHPNCSLRKAGRAVGKSHTWVKNTTVWRIHRHGPETDRRARQKGQT